MDDLISRQAAREALLDKGQSSRRYKLGESWELNWLEIEDALSSISTVDAEPVKHGELWVSCSERLPETLTETLDGRYSDCCLVFAEETEWIGMAYYRTNNNKSWWEFADAQNKPKIDWAEITHWMPLPNYPNCGAKKWTEVQEMKTIDKRLFDYRARLEAAKEHAERLLVLLRELNSQYTPDGISNDELEDLFKRLDEIYTLINELNGGIDGEMRDDTKL